MVAVVRTGDEFQARIPALLAPEQRRQLAQTAQPRYAQRWGAPPAAAEVARFLASCSRVAEAEQALQCLFASGFDPEAASNGLREARRRAAQAQLADARVLADDAFADAIAAHGKKFHFVKQALPGVASTRDVVRKFYQWKATAGYKLWRDQDRARKKKESARVLRRRWGDESDSDAPSDYHNEFCDLCFTGGQLLCCDGCCRAFHFSCVTPPISEVPKDDWFCAQCRALLGADVPRTSPSPENRFCGVVSIGGATASMLVARKNGSASGSSDAPDSEADDTGSISTDDSEVDPRAERPSASFTDQDESDGSEALRRRAKIRAEKAARMGGGASVTKPRHASSVESSPSVPSTASSRKRQRKLGAPRRILLSPTPSSNSLLQAKPRPST